MKVKWGQNSPGIMKPHFGNAMYKENFVVDDGMSQINSKTTLKLSCFKGQPVYCVCRNVALNNGIMHFILFLCQDK